MSTSELPNLILTELTSENTYRAVLFEIDPDTGAACCIGILETVTEHYVVDMAIVHATSSTVLVDCDEEYPTSQKIGSRYGYTPVADEGSRVRNPLKMLVQSCRRERLRKEQRRSANQTRLDREYGKALEELHNDWD